MPLTGKALEAVEVVGSVETDFEAVVRWRNNKTILNLAYYELLKIAHSKYDGKIDVKNIVVEKQYPGKNYLFLIPIIMGYGFSGGSFTNIYAKGEVIRYNEN